MSLQRYTFYNNNTYVRMINLTSQRSLRELAKNPCIGTNFPIPATKFFSMLINHERSHNFSKHRGLKIRYGSVFTFLLPSKKSGKKSIELLSAVLRKFPDLPYFAFLSTEGKGTYLNVYICERHFFENGKDTFVIAKKDRYRNAKTGKICTPDGVNTEDLQIVYKAGDIISADKVYFSAKTGDLKFASEEQFHYFIAKMKNFWISILEKICDVKVVDGATFHKASRKNATRSTIRNVRQLNKTISEMEKVFNDAIYAIKYCECYSRKAAKKMQELHKKYSSILKRGECTYENYKVNLNVRMRKKSFFDGSLELLMRKFREDLNCVFSEIVPQF